MVNDLVPSFTRVADELHNQYVIGFAAPILDGKMYKIALKVRPAGLTARARRSYVATAP